MKRILAFLLLLIFILLPLTSLSVSAEEGTETLPLTLSHSQRLLTDGKEKVSATVSEPLTVQSQMAIDSLYLLFTDTPTAVTLTVGEKSVEFNPGYLRQVISVSSLLGESVQELTLHFAQPVNLLELYGFGGELPSWVQCWEAPCEKADLCLMTSHADDEQLFFAGILPYYAGEKKLAVQVVYFTDHKNEPLRRHELLNGLWTVGVTHYPVISTFPDQYSTSQKAAENQWQRLGITREDVVGFQVEQIRRFRPLVVVGHDVKGEYGHGQHILNSATLQEALPLALDATKYPESAELYGTWQVPKLYLHLYEENQITMNWDIPLANFGGKTAFQVTQEGFLCHDSQQYTWFRRWLNGNNGQITQASQINTYSPCQYGLAWTTVGEDEKKDDFFEHLKSYVQQAQEAEQQRLFEEEQARKEAEQKKILQEERKKAEAEEEKRQAAEAKKKEEQKIVITVSIVVLVVFVLLGAVILRFRRQNPRGGLLDDE